MEPTVSEPPRDLFGRTESELVAAIAKGERVYAISETYRGNEGLALEIARKKANLDVDRRQLAILRGDPVRYDEPVRHLTPTALDQWRKDLLRRGRAGAK